MKPEDYIIVLAQYTDGVYVACMPFSPSRLASEGAISSGFLPRMQ
ncbi:MAG TPA: hypothetical protein VGQ41_01305 [Pyrinomonadaceae bacterium]|nr:hypothetical protein [Pyrinomonadaceae bacterium]